jgi:AraC-like DNA-binding protein
MGAARLGRVESPVVPADPVIFVESTRATTVPWIRAQFVMNAMEAAFPGNTAREVADAVGLRAPNGTEPPITLAQLDALYEEGARRTGDEAFGLHLAEHSDPRMFDLLGYALMNGKNLADAFEKLRPYLRTIHGNEELMLVVDGDRARFAYRVTDSRARPSRHRSEAYLGIVFKMAMVALSKKVPPVAVTFEHSAPKDTSEHRRFFGTQVHFDCPVNELVFASELLEEPIANADPTLAALLDRYIKELSAGAQKGDRTTLAGEVRRLIYESFRDGDHSARAIAKRLNMSCRTLQRRLRIESTSHHDILDEARQELALRYLRESTMPIGRIAKLLGYATVGAFYDAFHRWMSVTPADYRRSAR